MGLRMHRQVGALLESTVSAGHWRSRSTRAATGFADRKNIRRFSSPTLCPQSRTLHWSDGNEEVSITPPSNCALQLQASFRQSMVEAAARQYAKSRHGALRILRRHNPNNLGADCSRMQQQEHTGQHTKSSTVPPDSHGVYLTRNYALGISCGDFCR